MSIFDTLSGYGVIPVIAIDDAAHALPLADALISGGLPVAEITLRTPVACDAIAAIARHRPEVRVGAGTLLSEEQLDAAHSAGAAFGLAPGFDIDVVSHASVKGLPFTPGIMTPTDIQAAIKAGCRLLKFFPAMSAGGPSMLRNLAAPYAHTGICFNPTGGVSQDNVRQWLAIPEVAAVGGTWIATRKDIADGNWKRIEANAREAVAIVSECRSRS